MRDEQRAVIASMPEPQNAVSPFEEAMIEAGFAPHCDSAAQVFGWSWHTAKTSRNMITDATAKAHYDNAATNHELMFLCLGWQKHGRGWRRGIRVINNTQSTRLYNGRWSRKP